ncbi:OsmC family protein [Burkholderia ambifaria]|uniref:OsmC family protein n=1 Tax=Burkholderia ambifaria TaxID=152480 RepID=UPI000F814B22|nr:OsmC family protein [Burkholderia ambifaria]
MATHKATVRWACPPDQPFTDGRFSRVHQWSFDGGAVVKASPSPEVLREPMSDPFGVDPEEAFIAALSSCHMLFFLMFAAKAKCAVESYTDEATGTLSKEADGTVWMSHVILAPHVVFKGEKRPTREQVEEWHQNAHHACYIGNSVRSKILLEPTAEGVDG